MALRQKDEARPIHIHLLTEYAISQPQQAGFLPVSRTLTPAATIRGSENSARSALEEVCSPPRSVAAMMSAFPVQFLIILYIAL
jgi:hypothetical protein